MEAKSKECYGENSLPPPWAKPSAYDSAVKEAALKKWLKKVEHTVEFQLVDQVGRVATVRVLERKENTIKITYPGWDAVWNETIELNLDTIPRFILAEDQARPHKVVPDSWVKPAIGSHVHAFDGRGWLQQWRVATVVSYDSWSNPYVTLRFAQAEPGNDYSFSFETDLVYPNYGSPTWRTCPKKPPVDDCLVLCDTKEEIPAHRATLLESSPIWQRLFEGCVSPVLPGSESAVRALVKQEPLNVFTSEGRELLLLAGYFRLPRLLELMRDQTQTASHTLDQVLPVCRLLRSLQDEVAETLAAIKSAERPLDQDCEREEFLVSQTQKQLVLFEEMCWTKGVFTRRDQIQEMLLKWVPMGLTAARAAQLPLCPSLVPRAPVL